MSDQNSHHERLWDLLNGHLDEQQAEQLQAQPQARHTIDELEHELTTLLLSASPKQAPASNSREALISALDLSCRFERFVPQVAALLDLSEERARQYLIQIDEPRSWEMIPLPGVKLFHIEPGPAIERSITGFVKLRPGAVFPAHKHEGQEQALILQGTLIDTHSGRHGRGELVVMDESSEHLIEASPEMELIYLTIIKTGIKIFGLFIDHESPLM